MLVGDDYFNERVGKKLESNVRGLFILIGWLGMIFLKR